MANEFTAPPISNLVSITPLTTSPASRDATSVPTQLVGVAPGTTIEGFVVNRDAQSNPILRTALGDVLVKSDVFIKTGSEVVFRVDTTQPGHARILSIDGLPPQDYTAANARGMSSDTINATQMPSAAQAAQQAGVAGKAAAAPLTALLVSTTPLPAATIASNPLLAAVAAGTAPITPGLLKLTQGAQLQIKLLQISLPAPDEKPAEQKISGTPAPLSATLSTAAPSPEAKQLAPQSMANAKTAQLAVPDAPEPSAPSLATLVQRNGLPAELPNLAPQATIAAIKAQVVATNLPLPPAGEKPAVAPSTPAPVYPSTPNSLPPAPSSARTMPTSAPTPAVEKHLVEKHPAGMPAYVIGHEGDDATILQTPVGTLKMYLPQKLPIGTAVRMDVQLRPSPLANDPSKPLPVETNITTLAQEWPALEEALTLLPLTHTAARPLADAIPQIGPKLTSGLLFFIAAVKSGDLKQWVGGRALAALESRAPSLVERLKGDMAQLQTLLVDSPLQQWSSAMVPMLYQGQLEHARLFFRNDSESSDGKKKKSDGDQRFIVEVDTSHLGEVQFDGFVRKSQQAKQFDLIMRSSIPLPLELQQQVRATFETAMQTSGINGYLAFQQGSQHFVRPMADTGDLPDPQPILA